MTETTAEGATSPLGDLGTQLFQKSTGATTPTEATSDSAIADALTEAPSGNGQAQEADAILEALMARIAPVGATTTYLKVLIYGEPGVGKTVLGATAPKPLIVDIEKGTLSLRNHPELANTARLEFRSIFQLEQLIRKLREGALPEYETIVIDSISELQKRDLDEIVAQAAATDASRNKFLPLGPDYNINTEHMRQIISDLRDLDRHLVVTSSVKEEKDGTTGALLRRPNLTPKLADSMRGIFDVVGYLDVHKQGNEVVHTLQVHPTPQIQAKTRIGKLPPVITNPTFSILLDAFRKEIAA